MAVKRVVCDAIEVLFFFVTGGEEEERSEIWFLMRINTLTFQLGS